GFAAAPPGLRSLFDRQGKPEGCWDWFEIIATTTLAEGEHAVVLALVDDSGAPVAALPMAVRKGKLIRGLTSPFTTLFSVPLGTAENARLLGRHVARIAGSALRLDALDDADPAC